MFTEEDLRNRMQLINSNQITMEQIPKLNLGEQKSAIFWYTFYSSVVNIWVEYSILQVMIDKLAFPIHLKLSTKKNSRHKIHLNASHQTSL